MRELQVGSRLAGYRIDAVERADASGSVLLAHDVEADRAVALHVAGEPPGSLATTRFMERARRLRSVEHPHLLTVEGVETLNGLCVALAQAPPGRRLDRISPSRAASVRIVRQVASAVDAIEDAGAEPPPLIPARIWVDDAGDAHLDGLDAHMGLQRAASSSAALARLLTELDPRAGRTLKTVLDRAFEGAYLSAGQLAADLDAAEAENARQRRLAAFATGAAAALLLVVILLVIFD